MRRLTLPECSRRAFALLPRPAADALAATKAVRVGVDRAGRTLLSASSRVGVLRVGDVELRVTPKMRIRRLLWLLGHARDPAGWRTDEVVELSVVDDLIAAVAVSFLAATRRALAGGVLQGYRVTDEALPLLRGRLREADQFRARLGALAPCRHLPRATRAPSRCGRCACSGYGHVSDMAAREVDGGDHVGGV